MAFNDTSVVSVEQKLLSPVLFAKRNDRAYKQEESTYNYRLPSF